MEFKIIGSKLDIIEMKFVEYIMRNWINVIIYKTEQKNEIVDFAKKLDLKTKMKNHTFESIVEYLKHSCEFESSKIIYDELELDGKVYKSLIIYTDFSYFE